MQPSNILSSESLSKLTNVHPDLVKLVETVAAVFPCKVIEGFRSQAQQNYDYSVGTSKKRWPESKHNLEPSQAVDLSPIPYDPKDVKRLLFFAGFVLGVARQLGIPLRSGADWDGNFVLSDETFPDLFHFELVINP